MNAREVVSQALWLHQWSGEGAPSDECDCCADVMLAALEAAGWRIMPPPITYTYLFDSTCPQCVNGTHARNGHPHNWTAW